MCTKGAVTDLAIVRDHWLRQLGCARGRPGGQQCVATWDPAKRLARIVQERGNELHFFGSVIDGELWLRPEEALCLLEDGLLLLYHDNDTVLFSVQEAYERLLGTQNATLQYSVFNFLHRASFVSRSRSDTNMDVSMPPLLKVCAGF